VAIVTWISRTITRARSHFFSLEVFDELCGALQIQDCSPSRLRRNVIARGVDLNELISQDFEIQGTRFHGMEECRPCYWMDRAIAPGAHEFLKGRGGLRAKILNSGQLCSCGRNSGILPDWSSRLPA